MTNYIVMPELLWVAGALATSWLLAGLISWAS